MRLSEIIANREHIPPPPKKDKHMREFDLEAAKQGNRVQTRDGRKARILAFDIANEGGTFNLAVAVTESDGEYLQEYSSTGVSINGYNHYLVMAPEVKEYWIDIMRNKETGGIAIGQGYYDSKEDVLRQFISSMFERLEPVMIYKEEI